MKNRTMAVVAGAFLAMAAAGCGSGDSDDGTAADTADAAETASETEGPVVMVDVATGAEQDLDEALSPSDGKPLLAWFWAPYCPTCRGEAPGLDAFMADNAERVSMVGIGARNDLEYAQDFLEATGVSSFPLLWDETGQSWVDNAVAAQPYMILFDASGEEVERWPGGASVTQIEDALGTLG